MASHAANHPPRNVTLALLFIAFSFWPLAHAMAQDNDEGSETNLERYRLTEEGTGLKTFEEVSSLEDQARQEFSNDCQAAIPIVAEYADAANALANVLSNSLDPFCDASRDDRDIIIRNDRARFDELAEAEAAANALRKK